MLYFFVRLLMILSCPIVAYRGITIPLLCSYLGGSQGLSPTHEQAHVGSDLLTLVSIYFTIFRDKKEALHFGGAPFVASRGQILMQAWNSAHGMPRGNCSINFKKF